MSDNTEIQAAYKRCQEDNHHPELSNKQKLTLNLDNAEIQNFFWVDINEMKPTTQDIKENIFEEDLCIVVDELINLYFEETNKGKEARLTRKNALILYQKAAELENIVAQFDLSYMYICIEKDYNKAFNLSKKLSEKKYPCGINRLGYCYEKGIGTEINNQKTFELYKMAADLGNANGINNLGYCYEKGIGTEINEQRAFELYYKVADFRGIVWNKSLG
ncbi:unnamed protein product [Rhizophagus irregularis]|nr:unnamed protein product [Rhizophagus irregularis]